jgi:O-antigen ligase
MFQSVYRWMRSKGYEAPSFAAMNEWWTGYAVMIPGFAGSWLTFWYFGAVIMAMISLPLRHYRFNIPAAAKPFTAACLSYAAALTLAAAANGGMAELGELISKTAAFVLTPLLFSRFSQFDPKRSLAALCNYAPLGAALGLAAALVQQTWSSAPAEGGAGNASVFGAVMAWLAALSLAGCGSTADRKSFAALAGFAAGMSGLALSGTRSLYPLAALLPLLFLFTHRRGAISLKPAHPALLLAGIVFCGLLAWPVLKDAAATSWNDFTLVRIGRLSGSLGNRLALWDAALQAIAERPLTGHGLIGKMHAIAAHLPEQVSYLGFSHVHNIFLDTAVVAGIPGLAALAALFLTPLSALRHYQGDRGAATANFVLLGVILTCLASGMMGALFQHDLLTVLYLMPVTIVLSIDKAAIQD